MENGKAIEGYENYFVTTDGNVYNLKTGRKLKQRLTDKGYLEVGIRKDKKNKNFLVHRIVAKAFLENKNNKPSVNHIDGDRRNNNSNNLEWVTSKENYKSRVERGGGRISKVKVIKIYKSKKWENIDDFVVELMIL